MTRYLARRLGASLITALLASLLVFLIVRQVPGDVVAQMLGQTSDPDYLRDNPNRRCPDISKARAELDYEPIVALDEGLRRLLIWYGANSGGDDA